MITTLNYLSLVMLYFRRVYFRQYTASWLWSRACCWCNFTI